MIKGQAAMEYLMTYGWAILIVIVVVAALYAMGVFRIGGTPIGCSPCFTSFALVGYTKLGPAPSTGGSLQITSGSQEINVTAVTGGELVGGVNRLISPGTTLEIRNITNSTATTALTISYTVTSTGYPYTETATIHN